MFLFPIIIPLSCETSANREEKLKINNDIFFFHLIERTAVDHPHHTLFILFALANAEKDNKYLTGGKKNATASRLTRNNSKEASSGFTEVFWSTSITISVSLWRA